MAEQLESVFELRTKYGEERASMLNRLFTLPSEIAATDISMSPAVKEQLGKATFDKVRATEPAVAAQCLRDQIKQAYIENELEEQEAVKLLAARSQEVLQPESLDPNTLVTAAGLSEEQLQDAYNNIVEADNVTAAEPEEIVERVETYALPEITQQSILAGDHPELNKLGMIR